MPFINNNMYTKVSWTQMVTFINHVHVYWFDVRIVIHCGEVMWYPLCIAIGNTMFKGTLAVKIFISLPLCNLNNNRRWWYSPKIFFQMAAVYFNQSVSFPSLPKKKTFIEVSKFTKTCKQGVIFLDCKEWITFSFSPLKSHYVIST